MMKSQLNEYYQCSDRGYVKYENVKVDHLPVINQIPVASRCNVILPYKLHGIEVKKPIQINTTKETLKQVIEQPKELYRNEEKKQPSSGPLNYSFSVSLMQNQMKNLQKDEVHSIHFDDKNSARTKIDQREKDLTKSTFTYLRKPKYDMKRSLFQTNRSNLTNDTICKDSDKIDMIINQLAKEKEKREEFEQKYQVLFNLVNRNKQRSTTVSGINETQFSQQLPSPKYSPVVNRKINYHMKSMKSETESSEQSQADRQVVVDYRKGKRKCSSPSPIIINLGSELLYRNSSQKSSSKLVHSQSQISQLTEIKGSLQLIQQQVAALQDNVDFLQKKTEENEARRQKDMLMQQLKEKQRRIEQIVLENQKIKEINELLLAQKTYPQTNLVSFPGIALEKNTIVVSFIVSLLLVLIVLLLRGSIC